MTPPKYTSAQLCGAPGCGIRFGSHKFNKHRRCPIGMSRDGVPMYHTTRVFEPMASAKGKR